MPTGGNEIKFKWDPTMADDDGPQTIVKPDPAPTQPTQEQEEPEPQKPEPAKREAPSKGPSAPKDDAPAEPAKTGSKTVDKKNDGDIDGDGGKQKNQDFTDEQLIALYNKRKGTDYKSFDDFVQTKEVERIVEKEKDLPDHLKGYMSYYEETGRSLEDFTALNRDFSKMSNMELARDAVRRENEGLTLDNSEVDMLLAEKMGVDHEDLGELEGRELIKLKSFANKHRQSLIQEKEKYRQPLEPKGEPKKQEESRPVGETVTLSSGQTVSKEVYEKQRNQYNAARNKAVENITGFEIDMVVDNNGEEETVPFKWEHSDDDRHSMLSETEDVGTMLNEYQKPNGDFDHGEFMEARWRSKKENWERSMRAAWNAGRSHGVDGVLKDKKNINFDQRQKPAQEQKLPEGYVNGRLDEIRNSGGYRVKVGLPTQ